MKIKLYLDDERITPDGWVRCYTVPQCIAILRTGIVEEVSFDNDLGVGQLEGHTALDWLEETVYNEPDFPIPVVHVHSANEGRAPSMRQVMEKLHRLRFGRMGYGDSL